MQRLQSLRRSVARWVEPSLAGVAGRLNDLNVTPNAVTWTGVLLTVASAGMLMVDWLPAAAVIFVVASSLDMLDGALARAGGRATAYGAFLDSTLDRVGEGAVLAAIAYRFAEQGRALDAGLVVVAALLALLVSYTRARAEGLGISCDVGLLTRPERVVVLAVGMFAARLDIAVYVLVFLGTVTVAQRVIHVRRVLDAAANDP